MFGGSGILDLKEKNKTKRNDELSTLTFQSVSQWAKSPKKQSADCILSAELTETGGFLGF